MNSNGMQELTDRLSHHMKTWGMGLEDTMSEIVADSCDQILANETVMQHIQETDKSLYTEVKGFVKNLVERIKQAVTGMSGSASRDARALAQSANEIAKVWLGAYDEALTGVEQNKVDYDSEKPDFSTMRESKAETAHDEVTLENNKYIVANMDSVIKLNGDEITINEDHKAKAFALFDSLKGVESEAAGWINLNKQGVRDSYGHGYGPLKVLLFASVPDVLQKGKIIAYTENRNNQGYDTAIIAAPVHVNGGELAGDYYVGAIIKLYNDGHNKFYTHDGTAAITNKNGIAHLTAGPREGSGRRSDSHLLVNILDELNKYNGKNGIEDGRLSRAEKNNEGASVGPMVDDIDNMEQADSPSTTDIINDMAYRVKLDQEYEDAAGRGDIKKTTEMLLKKLADTQGVIPFMAPEWDAGEAGKAAWLFKVADPETIATADGGAGRGCWWICMWTGSVRLTTVLTTTGH